MAAFFRAMRPHIKPLGSNCVVYGVLYGGAEFTQQAKGIYYDVRFFLNNEIIKAFSHFSFISNFAFFPNFARQKRKSLICLRLEDFG